MGSMRQKIGLLQVKGYKVIQMPTAPFILRHSVELLWWKILNSCVIIEILGVEGKFPMKREKYKILIGRKLGEVDEKLLFQSSSGIQFNKEVSKGLCTVKVQTKPPNKRAYTLMRYTYPNVALSVSSPFLSWENLNCCNGWAYDEDYLLTAVQEGKKLYAGSTIRLQPPIGVEEAEARLEEFRSTLPDTCLAGKEMEMNDRFFPFYICRRGRLKDYFDLEQVLGDYKRMGITLSAQDKRILFHLGGIELAQFATGKPMCYFRCISDVELMITGLLLGYPLESTASLLLEDQG